MSSCVIVQVGQCGNSLGISILEQLGSHCLGDGWGCGPHTRSFPFAPPSPALPFPPPLSRAAPSRSTPALLPAIHSPDAARARATRLAYFYPQTPDDEQHQANRGQAWTARALLIDTEEKTLAECMRQGQQGRVQLFTSRRQPPFQWSYDEDSVVTGASGSGNNWAVGFNQWGPAAESAIETKARRQAERCDRLDAFLTIQGAAGGTGSGLGSFTCSVLRDLYGSSVCLYGVLVLPFAGGDVALQSYNTALSVAALMESANSILMIENDSYLSLCGPSSEPAPFAGSLRRSPSGSYRALNCCIATSLVAGCLLPSCAATAGNISDCGGPAPSRAPGVDPRSLLPPPTCRYALPLRHLALDLCPTPYRKLVTCRTVPRMQIGDQACFPGAEKPAVLMKELRRLVARGGPLPSGAASAAAPVAAERGAQWSAQASSRSPRLLSRGPTAPSSAPPCWGPAPSARAPGAAVPKPQTPAVAAWRLTMRGLPQAEVLRAAREAIEAGWLPPSILAHSGPHGQAAAPPPPAADQVRTASVSQQIVTRSLGLGKQKDSRRDEHCHRPHLHSLW
eukprot:GHVT01040573.1.p1 GENE.GHVT01040573.1~~GHVT01040573.1.p1  ORF type:complete len:565 (+),score=118.57 GHVT01040573.1:1080-2774(+)